MVGNYLIELELGYLKIKSDCLDFTKKMLSIDTSENVKSYKIYSLENKEIFSGENTPKEFLINFLDNLYRKFSR